jgi:hypothetical protein
MRILRCELCERPCTMTKFDDADVLFCPVSGETASWRQINSKKSVYAPQVRPQEGAPR